VPERFAPGGPLALALEAVAEERYADALDRLEQAVSLAHAPDQAPARELARRLAARIALEGPCALRARAELVAEAPG
jgi:hypothetical protein